MNRTLTPWTARFAMPIARVEQEMEEMMKRFWGGERALLPVEAFAPHINIAETEKAYEVTVELPGLKPEEFHLEVKNGELWITGEKNEEKEEKGKTYHRVERRYGEFRRILPLPAMVKEEAVQAKYEAGVLTVTLPKPEEVLPKKVQIEVKG